MAEQDPRFAYGDAFERFEPEAPGSDVPWLRELRRRAMDRFLERGFPTLKDEAWRYTNVAPIARTTFRPAAEVSDGVTQEDLERIAFHGFRGHQIAFVNGRYASHLSDLGDLPKGVELLRIAEVLQEEPEVLETHVGKYAAFDGAPFVALNTAFWEDGVYLRIPKGVVVPEPIHLAFLSRPHGDAIISHPRNLVVVDPGAQATVVESFAGWGDTPYFLNSVTEVVVGEDARFDHYKLQRESDRAFHVGHLQVLQARGSNVADRSIAFGGALVRNDVKAWFGDEGGELNLDGLYVAGGRQHVDNHTRIDHAKPHCTSFELYKGILDGYARAIFYGNIVVHKDAQKTNAMQTNKNLLLSKDALVDSIPGLQILANDVRCRHGSSIGHLEQEPIFYLRSRGIDEEAAAALITYGFAAEVVNRIKVLPLRAAVGAWILSRLPKSELIKEAL